MCVGHNSLWYAFITDGDVVTLPARSQQVLRMGPSLQDTAAMNGTDVLVGSSISSYQCCSVVVNIFNMITSWVSTPPPPPPPPPPTRQVWHLGTCDTSHTQALGVMRIVPDRSAVTLLLVIQQHARSGTIVIGTDHYLLLIIFIGCIT